MQEISFSGAPALNRALITLISVVLDHVFKNWA